MAHPKLSETTKKIIISQVIILLVLVGLLVYFGVKTSSPEAVASQFVKDYNAGRWANVYSDFMIGDGELLTKKAFVTTMKRNSKEKLGTLSDPSRVNGAYIYTVKNGNHKMQITVTKSSEKMFFVFDKYIIEGVVDDEITVPASIVVPEYTDIGIKIDGIKVKGTIDDYSNLRVDVFRGTHTVTFENADGMFSKKKYKFNTDKETDLSKVIKYSKKAKENAQETAKKYIDTISEVTIKNQKKDKLNGYFVSPKAANTYGYTLCPVVNMDHPRKIGKLKIVCNVLDENIYEQTSHCIPIGVEGSRPYTHDGLTGSAEEDTCQISGTVYMTWKDKQWLIYQIHQS